MDGKRLLGLFILISLSHGLTAGAETCSTVDLRADLGAPRDQGDTGWCFAHTTADLIGQALKVRISSMAVAADYILTDSKGVLARANPTQKAYLRSHPKLLKALDESRTDEAERWLASTAYEFSETQLKNGKRFTYYNGLMNVGGMEDGAMMVANLNGYCLDGKLPDGDSQYVEYAKELKASYEMATYFAENCKPGTFQSGAIDEILGFAGKLRKDPSLVLANFVEKRCGARVPIPNPLYPRSQVTAGSLEEWNLLRKKNPVAARSRQSKLFEELDQNLERGRVSAIGYDYCEHGKPNPETGECTLKASLPSFEAQSEEDHSAIIAARKMMNGKCHYFVRNSVGATCDTVSEKLMRAGRCEANAGGVWVNREELRTLYSVISIR